MRITYAYGDDDDDRDDKHTRSNKYIGTCRHIFSTNKYEHIFFRYVTGLVN